MENARFTASGADDIKASNCNILSEENPLILASTSPRRRELIRELGIPFIASSADGVTELSQQTAPLLSSVELALLNAMRKAHHVAAEYGRAAENRHECEVNKSEVGPQNIHVKHHYVLGADTIVTMGDRILGKPRDITEAAEFLRHLSGQTHFVLTALALALPFTRSETSFPTRSRCHTIVERTAVTFRPLSEADIALYLEEVPVLDKAGAYALQQRSDILVASLEGSPSNVIGLPLEALREMLLDAGLL
ncbi:MAG: nucleoside triphosphate pyrophosphatase [Candidatus Methylacidiphilales bacterium]|nr:Maf family protein [Candidatus Methylacidiphilales bacterium]